MRSRPQVILALMVPGMALAQAPMPPSLDAGPHAVGVREFLLRDASRPTLPLREGEAARDARGRQMHIVLWYPAVRASGRPMTRGDYVNMAAHGLDFSPLAPDRRAKARDALISRSAGLGGDTAELRRRLPTLLDAPVSGRLDARAIAGRHPLILFPEWQPPAVNNILAEHLASHGYVVASAATKGTYDEQIEYWSPRGFETMVADLRFVLTALDTVSVVDPRRVGAIGVGIAASGALGLAMRMPSIAAVVSLEGGITTEGEMNLLMRTPYFDIANVRVPMLAITAPHPSVDPSRLDLYRYAPRHLVHFPHMGEFWFLDYGMLERASPKIIGTPPGDVAAGYVAGARFVRRFFDAHIRQHVSAREWLAAATPARLGVPDGFFTTTVKPALPAPPTVAELKAMLQRGGVEAIAAIVRERTPRDSQPIPPEYFVELSNATGVDGTTRFELARLRARMYPGSSRANYSLGATALARGDTALARTHLAAALRVVASDRDPLLDQTTRQRIERQTAATLESIGR
jgi:hypothetical protein